MNGSTLTLGLVGALALGATVARRGSAILWTPAELDAQIAQLQRGLARRRTEIARLQGHAPFGPGYAEALSEKREALAYHERELENVRAQRAEWGKGSAARTASDLGRYRFVTTCVNSTSDDIHAMKATATEVSRATFARALGPEAWARVQKELGYDRDFRISGDWHVNYEKGTYRGVPAYWLTHSGIEWIFTLDGEEGKSRARRRGSRSTLSDERLLKLARVGMCGEFAVALHREFGYRLGAFYEVGPDGWAEGDATLLHAFAYHPSGKLVDSKGIRSKAKMKSELYTMDGGKVEEHPTTEGDLDALSMEGLDVEVMDAARSYIQRNRATFEEAGKTRGSRSIDGFDGFDDDGPEPEPSPEAQAWRAFEAAQGTLAEHIDATELVRAWPAGLEVRVGLVPRHARGATPGWFVYASAARTEAEAERLGRRLQTALIAPRSLRADQVRLHTLPLTVGWSGGTVQVGPAR